MRFVSSILFVSSIIAAVHGMVIFSPWQATTTPSIIGRVSSVVQWFQTNFYGGAESTSNDLVDDVTADLFWDQSKAEQSADARKNHYELRWNDLTNEWVVDLKTGDLPDDESFTVDYIFDIQMLIMWMNARKLKASYFGSKLDDVKSLFTAESQNAVWIPTDLYCAKCAALAPIMEAVLSSGKCTNAKTGDAVVNYMQQTTKNAKGVLPKIQSIIAGVNRKDADDFGTTMTIALGCMTGRA